MRQGPVAAGERRDTSSARLAAEPPFSSAGPRRQPSNLLLTRLGQQQSDGSGHSQPTEMKGESGALPSHSGQRLGRGAAPAGPGDAGGWGGRREGTRPPPGPGSAGAALGRGSVSGATAWARDDAPPPGRVVGALGAVGPALPCPARPAPRLRSARPGHLRGAPWGAAPSGNGGAVAPAPLLTLTRVTLASRRSCCTTFFMAATLEEPDMVAATAGGTPRPNFPARPKLSARGRLRNRRRDRLGGRCGAAGSRGAEGRGAACRAVLRRALRGGAEPQSERWGCIPVLMGRGSRPPAVRAREGRRRQF